MDEQTDNFLMVVIPSRVQLPFEWLSSGCY